MAATTEGRTGRQGALAGFLAAAAALVTAEIVGLLLPDRPSLLQGVGDRIITSVPDGVREGLIQLVGTLDKPLLLVGIVIVLLGGAAVLGAVSRDRPGQFRVAVVVVAVIAGSLSLGSSTSTILGTVVIAGAGAIAAQCLYARLMVAAGPAADAVAAGAEPAPALLQRRAFLRAAGLAAVGVAVGTAVVAEARRTLTSLALYGYRVDGLVAIDW